MSRRPSSSSVVIDTRLGLPSSRRLIGPRATLVATSTRRLILLAGVGYEGKTSAKYTSTVGTRLGIRGQAVSTLPRLARGSSELPPRPSLLTSTSFSGRQRPGRHGILVGNVTAVPETANVLNAGPSYLGPCLVDGTLEKDEVANPKGPCSIRPCNGVVQPVLLGRPSMGLAKTRPTTSMRPTSLPFDSRPTTSITSWSSRRRHILA